LPEESSFNSKPDNLLSKRENEILILITQEYTSQKIAEKLFISERTVETHRKNILSKTGVKSIVGLIKYAIDEGIIIYNKDQKF
jgi:DNA-binding CsgD family transcriptional regulator